MAEAIFYFAWLGVVGISVPSDCKVKLTLSSSLAVNYGGSSGFGRAYRFVTPLEMLSLGVTNDYRESLDSKWGILDIHDAYHSVLKLDEMGLVDQKRAVVHGDSAGGYSILQMAATLPTAFAAGASQYGFSDMKKFSEVLHKFEYGLCERMMGGRFEDIPEVWRARTHGLSARQLP